MPTHARPLEALGISPDQERLYQVLLNQPGLTAAALARHAGLSIKAGSRSLAFLEGVGLVTRSSTSPVLFSVAPPDLGVGALIMAREQELKRVRMSVPGLVERFRSTVAQTQSGLFQLVEFEPEPGAILRRYEAMLATAETEVVSFDKPPYAANVEEPNLGELEALARGVRVRAIYDPSALEMPRAIENLAIHARAGEEARIADEVPSKLVIVDQATALIPIDTGSNVLRGTLFLHKSSLLGALYDLFERWWEASRTLELPGIESTTPPLSPRHQRSAELSALDARVFLLLREGLKDQAIAAQLQLSLTTVERRIRRAMRELGARSRFQAGVEATLRGWTK
ncbi:MAG: helix-turn-helix transcriptional regulator [Candidatus Dormibacteria bacterium]